MPAIFNYLIAPSPLCVNIYICSTMECFYSLACVTLSDLWPRIDCLVSVIAVCLQTLHFNSEGGCLQTKSLVCLSVTLDHSSTPTLST